MTLFYNDVKFYKYTIQTHNSLLAKTVTVYVGQIQNNMSKFVKRYESIYFNLKLKAVLPSSDLAYGTYDMSMSVERV